MKKMLIFGMMFLLLVGIVTAYGGGSSYIIPSKFNEGKHLISGERYELKIINKINENEVKELDIKDSKLVVKSLSIESFKDYKSISVFIKESLDNKSPKNIEVNSKFEIKSNIDNKNLKEIKIRFKIDRWYDKEYIWNMYHYDNSNWKIENVVLVGKTTRNFIYETSVENLSLFVVGGTLKEISTPTTTTTEMPVTTTTLKEVVEDSVEVVGDSVEPVVVVPEEPEPTKKKWTWIVLGIWMIALGIMGYAYYKSQNDK